MLLHVYRAFFSYGESKKDAYKARCGNPTGFLGCRFWNGITDPSVAACTAHQGPSRPSGNTTAKPGTCQAYWHSQLIEPSTSAGPIGTRPQMSSGLQHSLSPPRSTLKRTDRAGLAAKLQRLWEEPRGSSTGRRGEFTIPHAVCHLHLTLKYVFVNTDLLTSQSLRDPPCRPHSSNEEMLAQMLQLAEGACRV